MTSPDTGSIGTPGTPRATAPPARTFGRMTVVQRIVTRPRSGGPRAAGSPVPVTAARVARPPPA